MPLPPSFPMLCVSDETAALWPAATEAEPPTPPPPTEVSRRWRSCSSAVAAGCITAFGLKRSKVRSNPSTVMLRTPRDPTATSPSIELMTPWAMRRGGPPARNCSLIATSSISNRSSAKCIAPLTYVGSRTWCCSMPFTKLPIVDLRRMRRPFFLRPAYEKFSIFVFCNVFSFVCLCVQKLRFECAGVLFSCRSFEGAGGEDEGVRYVFVKNCE